ncbi:unnamed protein product [Pedinophyceae sp. YPF-701]|nr:unnamed protein product [Pedinophyceae sp. YPF-701]
MDYPMGDSMAIRPAGVAAFPGCGSGPVYQASARPAASASLEAFPARGDRLQKLTDRTAAKESLYALGEAGDNLQGVAGKGIEHGDNLLMPLGSAFAEAFAADQKDVRIFAPPDGAVFGAVDGTAGPGALSLCTGAGAEQMAADAESPASISENHEMMDIDEAVAVDAQDARKPRQKGGRKTPGSGGKGRKGTALSRKAAPSALVLPRSPALPNVASSAPGTPAEKALAGHASLVEAAPHHNDIDDMTSGFGEPVTLDFLNEPLGAHSEHGAFATAADGPPRKRHHHSLLLGYSDAARDDSARHPTVSGPASLMIRSPSPRENPAAGHVVDLWRLHGKQETSAAAAAVPAPAASMPAGTAAAPRVRASHRRVLGAASAGTTPASHREATARGAARAAPRRACGRSSRSSTRPRRAPRAPTARRPRARGARTAPPWGPAHPRPRRPRARAGDGGAGDARGRRHAQQARDAAGGARRGAERHRRGAAPLEPIAPPAQASADVRRKAVCHNCGATSTPQWRCGPDGPRTLCNACGVRFKKGLPLDKYPNVRNVRQWSVSRR